MKEKWDYFDMNDHGGHISFFNPISFDMLSDNTGFNLEHFYTKNVAFYKKDDVSRIKYRAFKILSELLKPLFNKLNKGHDMVVFLRKK